MALFTYMNQVCYEKVTCDSTTYTIKAMQYPKLFLENESGWVKSFSLVPKQYKGITTFDKCECPLCAYYLLEYGYPLSKDVIDFKNENLNAGTRLRHRVIPHNICVIRKFQEKLRSILNKGRTNYIEFLKLANQDNVIEAIELVDRVISGGRWNYRKKIKLINDSKS
jgi:hypothetical protein